MKQTVTVILALGVLLHSTISLWSSELQPSVIVASAMVAKSSVIGCISATMLPFIILNAVICGEINLADKISKGQKENKRNTATNTSSDCSLNSFESVAKPAGASLGHCGIVGGMAALSYMQVHNGCRYMLCRETGQAHTFLLGYLVVLSRTSLPGGMVNNLIHIAHRKPGLRT